jgi:diphthamide synthase (EF-2-diphthine--ammonia ligase)
MPFSLDLAREMIDAGVVAYVTCIDPKVMPKTLVGRRFDHEFLDELPNNVDPCGENGEFHTFVSRGPMFAHDIEVEVGQTEERDGFLYADLLPL